MIKYKGFEITPIGIGCFSVNRDGDTNVYQDTTLRVVCALLDELAGWIDEPTYVEADQDCL